VAQELRGLVARRRRRVEMHTAEENRCPTTVPSLRPQLEAHLASLEIPRAARDRALERTLQESPIWRAKEALLRAIPGVGPVVARTLLAELPELGTLTRQEAVALARVAPRNRDSGHAQRPRNIGGGRSGVRAKRSMAALTAARCAPAMHAFDDRLERHGKPPKVALVACRRKVPAVANAILRDGVAWHPQGGAVA
jgi:transposase